MALPQIRTITLTVGVANGIALSQAPGTSAFTLNGSLATAGVATLSPARRVVVTSSGNDSAITFKLVGTDRYGNAISEVLAGTNATSSFTAQDFLTVASITPSAAVAANVTAGTNGVASSEWANLSNEISPVNVGLALVWAGTATAGIEYTYDDPNGAPGVNGFNGTSVVPAVLDHPVLVGIAGTVGIVHDGSLAYPCWGWRLKITAGSGGVTATGRAGGIAGN